MIARFVNDEFRIQRLSERREYLSRLGKAVSRVDWSVIGYALMSSHIHLSLLAGFMPFEALARRIHPAFALWLNRRQKKRGPLFAGRPDTYTIDILRAPQLLSYLHNNPVKAGLCIDAKGTRWTSHRAYTGNETAPPWLRVDLGLKMSGLDNSEEGREEFNSLVLESSRQKDQWPIGENTLIQHRKEARDALGSAVLMGYPHVEPVTGEAVYPIISNKNLPLHHKWTGPLISLIDFVSAQLNVERHVVQSKSRVRTVVNARRIVLLIARNELGRGLSETSRTLGITPQAGLQLIETTDNPTKVRAQRLAQRFLHHEKL